MNVKDQFDLVIMFGLDTSLKDTVRIERVAELEGTERVAAIDCDKISRCLTANEVRCVVSNIPTQYLCNAVYFHMLQNSIWQRGACSYTINEKYVSGNERESVRYMEAFIDVYRI